MTIRCQKRDEEKSQEDKHLHKCLSLKMSGQNGFFSKPLTQLRVKFSSPDLQRCPLTFKVSFNWKTFPKRGYDNRGYANRGYACSHRPAHQHSHEIAASSLHPGWVTIDLSLLYCRWQWPLLKVRHKISALYSPHLGCTEGQEAQISFTYLTPKI